MKEKLAKDILCKKACDSVGRKFGSNKPKLTNWTEKQTQHAS